MTAASGGDTAWGRVPAGVRRYLLALSAASVAIVVTSTISLISQPVERWSLIVAFALAWSLVDHVPAAGSDHPNIMAFTPTEALVLPLVVTLPPAAAIITVTFGALGGRAILRFVSPWARVRHRALDVSRTVFSMNNDVIPTAAGAAAFSAVPHPEEPLALALAAVSAGLVFWLTTVILTAGVMQRAGQRSFRTGMRTGVTGRGLVVSICANVAGVVLAAAVLSAEPRWAVVLLGAALLAAVSFVVARLGTHRERAAELLAASDELHGDLPVEEVVDRLVHRAQEMFDCAYAEVRTDPAREGEMGVPLATTDPIAWLVVGEPADGFRSYSAAEHDLLRALAAIAAGALANARQVQHLRQLDDLKSGLLAAVAHDLRSPLGTSAGLLATLRLRHDDLSTDQRAELLAGAERSARRAARLVGDLLDLERHVQGLDDPAARACDVNVVVAELLDEIVLPGRPSVELDGGPAPVAIDGAKLRSIVENLLVNAAKHSPRDGTIHVNWDERDGAVEIRVDDEGPGVPDAFKTAIFDAFTQSGTAEDRRRGYGLGMHIASQFALMHGGRIDVTDRPGGGARFVITLPSADPARQTEPAGTPRRSHDGTT